MTDLTPTYKLKFTGDCDEAEFKSRCGEHDFWYHSFYFDNGYVQHGDYDIGHDIASYGFPENMAGLSVLDVGTGSGWFAAYFEQRGAEVTTLDARGYCDFDVYGRSYYPDVATEKPLPDRILPDGRAIYYSPVSRGFWIMKDILGLKAEYVNARIYDMCPALFGGKKFDLVFMGAVLMHLRDPIGALMAAHSVCGHRLMATSLFLDTAEALRFLGFEREQLLTGEEEEEVPMMHLLAAKVDRVSWWMPNKSCLAHWFRGAGFTEINAEKTVKLTVDSAFVDEAGVSSAGNQTLYLVDAYIEGDCPEK